MTRKGIPSTTTPPPAPKLAPTPAEEVRANLQLIERAVSTLEPRYTARVLRSLTTLRKKLDAKAFAEVVGGLKGRSQKKMALSRNRKLATDAVRRSIPVERPTDKSTTRS
ncbi:hypothetical protein M407DRAFT_120576 [Tulasnella calospora MUT 4182]|uniref:Uncharacterized protein n=1 Tax=Tulasnella calospora MUT 4182 TaxID=1051891 RepID=A0A0C3LL75_9AGAM|nr:hypothetical protein M407DRAFT_120576 [Tulasnella calospora MUT 4182]